MSNEKSVNVCSIEVSDLGIIDFVIIGDEGKVAPWSLTHIADMLSAIRSEAAQAGYNEGFDHGESEVMDRVDIAYNNGIVDGIEKAKELLDNPYDLR